MSKTNMECGWFNIQVPFGLLFIYLIQFCKVHIPFPFFPCKLVSQLILLPFSIRSFDPFLDILGYNEDESF